MSEDTKKAPEQKFGDQVQETNKNFINSNYIIKSHELIQQGFAVYLLLRLGIPTKVAYEIVDLVNSRSSVPLADKEINKIFRSVYEREKRRLLGGQ